MSGKLRYSTPKSIAESMKQVQGDMKKNAYLKFLEKIPPAFRAVEMEMFATDLRLHIRRMFKEDGLGILVFGDYGSGKTSLAWAVAKRFFYNYCLELKTVQVSFVPELLQTIQEEEKMFSGNPLDKQTMKHAKFVSFLILDDLGSKRFNMTPAEIRILETILDFRYVHKKRTMIISNLNDAELRAQIGARAYARIERTIIGAYELKINPNNAKK